MISEPFEDLVRILLASILHNDIIEMILIIVVLREYRHWCLANQAMTG